MYYALIVVLIYLLIRKYPTSNMKYVSIFVRKCCVKLKKLVSVLLVIQETTNKNS